MQRPTEVENTFVVDLLTTLRKEKFSLGGWLRFLGRSWNKSCQTANANPLLKRSWLRTTIGISILTIAILLANLFCEGTERTLKLLPGFVFCLVWQQSDLFWHLGLNRLTHTGELRQRIGLANTLTWLRGVAASYLIGRLAGGIPTPSWLALTVFLCGIATDILDGQIARRTGTQSKLGQVGDGEVDLCLYTAIDIILIQNQVLSLWLGLIMLLRFAIPLCAGLGSYFLAAQPVRFSSTIWGKSAGLAQCLYFLVLLAPPQLTFIASIANLPLLIAALILMFAAPLAQILQNIRPTP